MKKRRQMGMAFMVLALAAMMIPTALAKGPKADGPVATVEICHVNGASDVINGFTTPKNKFAIGQIMRVPEAALAGHAGHGDVETSDPLFRLLSATLLEDAAERDELTIWKHADCAVWLNP